MKKNIRNLLEEVIEEIKPEKEYEKKIVKEIDELLKKINSGLRNAKAELGGSGAKGTWLKSFDADIFVLFDYEKFKDKSQKISDIIEKHLKNKKLGKLERIHGSRDYFQIRKEDMTIEIIPLLNIKDESQAKNITDISQLHSRWVKKNAKGKLKDEIRLTKQFCKANGIYGAESYIQGLSGYVCEILTIKFGSFLKLVKAASKWKDQTVIDVENFYKGKDVNRELNQSKLVSPLIIIDPVQKSRNAGAAISDEKFEFFIDSCKKFIKKPNRSFFEIKKINIDELKKDFKNKVIVKVEVVPVKKGKRDVVGSSLLKAFDFLVKESLKYGFKIIDYMWEWDENKEVNFIIIYENREISEEITLIGPPINMKEHVERFNKAHRQTFIQEDKIMAIKKRKFTIAKNYIKWLVKESYFLEKVKVKSLGVF